MRYLGVLRQKETAYWKKMKKNIHKDKLTETYSQWWAS